MKRSLPLEALRLGFGALGRVLPDTMGAAAYRLWFRTTRRGVRAHEAAILERARHTTLGFGDTPLAVYSWGEGSPVLLVHGWNGRAAQMTPLVDPLVAAGHRVIAFDAPAHGRTPGRRTNAFEMAAALERVGHEYGRFAGAAAHSLGSLACAVAHADGMLDVGRAVCLAPAVTREPLVDAYATILQLPAGARASFVARVDDFVGPGFWKRAVLGVPTLVVHDRDDEDIPFTDGASLQQRWPHVHFHATAGLGHRGVLRDPTVLTASVSFLTQGAIPPATTTS